MKRQERGAPSNFPRERRCWEKARIPIPRCSGSLDDLPHLPLLPLSDTSAPGSHHYVPRVVTSHPESPCLAGSVCSPLCQTLLQNVLSPCLATSSQSLPFELSPQVSLSISLLTTHQLFQANSHPFSPTPLSLSSLFSSFAPRSYLFFTAPSPRTCFFACFTFRCPICCS